MELEDSGCRSAQCTHYETAFNNLGFYIFLLVHINVVLVSSSITMRISNPVEQVTDLHGIFESWLFSGICLLCHLTLSPISYPSIDMTFNFYFLVGFFFLINFHSVRDQGLHHSY